MLDVSDTDSDADDVSELELVRDEESDECDDSLLLKEDAVVSEDSLVNEDSLIDEEVSGLEGSNDALGIQLDKININKVKTHTFCFILFIIKRINHFAFNMLERTYGSTITRQN